MIPATVASRMRGRIERISFLSFIIRQGCRFVDKYDMFVSNCVEYLGAVVKEGRNYFICCTTTAITTPTPTDAKRTSSSQCRFDLTACDIAALV